MQDRTASLRTFFARYVAALARASSEIEQAFARIEREPFAGPGPWSVNIPGVGYVATPTDDPAFLYQDTLVALNAAKGVNIGLPSAHAMWLNAFISCDGRQDLEAAKRLNAAYAKGGARDVRSFRRDHPVAGSCWYAGDDWWLSTAEPRA